MSGARVTNVDALKHFRVALIKFAEAANTALGSAESDVNGTLMWLQSEQPAFWEGQIRKRHELVNRCKDEVRQKKLFKDSTGRTQSAVDEEKRLAIAQRRLAEAEQRLVNTKRHSQKLQRESHMFKGAIMRLTTNVTSDIPTAVATLDRMVQSLEAYLALQGEFGGADVAPVAGAAGASGGSQAGAMKRSDVEEMAAAEATDTAAAANDGQEPADPAQEGSPTEKA